MFKSLFLALSLVPSLALADAPSGDITISISRPMFGVAFPWGELSKDPALLAQLHGASQPTFPSLRMAADSVVSVILKNCSSHDVRLWRESNVWGYANVGFIFTLKSGQKILIKRNPQRWSQNSPFFYLLHPQEELVLNENPFDQSWDWSPDELHLLGLQSTNTGNINPVVDDVNAVTITPVYSVTDDSENLCRQNQVWTGAIHGEGLKVHLKGPTAGSF